MTERLYYTDPSILEFDAIVVSERQEGERVLTMLDRSAFYPNSGGQLFDKGTLNGAEIIDVGEEESGDVAHVTVQRIGAAGTKVHGSVEQLRRWKNRQMHTAQHIVSQTIIQLYKLDTLSVHLGDDYATVELDCAALSVEQITQLEDKANEIVSANLDVEILFVSPEQAAGLPLRKIPERTGLVRVIKIGEFDWSACGGTHCARTGEVGVIKVIGTEKMRGHLLVRFLSGVQAVADYRLRFEATDRLSRSQSCGISDLPGKIEKIVDENKQLRKELSLAFKELLPVRAAKMALGADRSGRIPFSIEIISDSETETAGLLASAIASQIEGLSAIICGDKCYFAVNQNGAGDAGAIAKELAARFSLRGGGSSRAAQIGGISEGLRDQFGAAIREIVTRA